ncbi:MAG: hypothetical protein KGH63_02340 [Candidatus Micrarchaeota archaeon]|nr:hypothetical protein [Candidatus Micrarchaeota archaeon]
MAPAILLKKEDPYAKARREIDQIVSNPRLDIWEKTRLLGVRSVDYLTSRTGSAAENKAISKLFHDAREEQRVWGIIHLLSESPQKKVEGLAKIEDRLVARAIENDPALRIDEKVHWLAEVSRLSGEHQAGLRLALRRQLGLLSPISLEIMERNRQFMAAGALSLALPAKAAPAPAAAQAGVLRQAKIGAAQVMAQRWVSNYAKKYGGKLDASARAIVECHWAEISRDVDKLWANRGRKFEYDGLVMWGPSNSVTLRDLAALVALSYLNQHRSGLDAHFLQSIFGKETNFRATGVDGPAGSGLTQMTSIGVAGVVERADDVSDKLKSWGHAGLDEHIGFVPRRKRWESLVQVEKTARVRVGRGRRARYKDKVVRYEPDFSDLQGKLVRGPRFAAYMADPANILELTTALLIVKGAYPGMSRETMREAATNYNGNNALFTTPEGEKMRVKDRYGQEVSLRVKWEGQSWEPGR